MTRSSTGAVFISAVLGAAVAIACGGQVVFEEPNDGGSGGSGTTGPGGTKATTGTKSTVSTTGQTTTTNNQVSSVSSTMTSGGCSVPSAHPTDCFQACTILYSCGQTFCGGTEQLCPAFTPNIISQDQFLMGCIQQCQDQMALISIIDPDKCDATIQTLQGVSFEFAQLCAGDFGG